MQESDIKILTQAHNLIALMLETINAQDFSTNKTNQFAFLGQIMFLGELLNPNSQYNNHISSGGLQEAEQTGTPLPCKTVTEIRNALMYNFFREIDHETCVSMKDDLEIFKFRIVDLFVMYDAEKAKGWSEKLKEVLNQYSTPEEKKDIHKNSLNGWSNPEKFAANFYQKCGATQNTIANTRWDPIERLECVIVAGESEKDYQVIKEGVENTQKTYAQCYLLLKCGQAARHLIKNYPQYYEGDNSLQNSANIRVNVIHKQFEAPNSDTIAEYTKTITPLKKLLSKTLSNPDEQINFSKQKIELLKNSNLSDILTTDNLVYKQIEGTQLFYLQFANICAGILYPGCVYQTYDEVNTEVCIWVSGELEKLKKDLYKDFRRQSIVLLDTRWLKTNYEESINCLTEINFFINKENLGLRHRILNQAAFLEYQLNSEQIDLTMIDNFRPQIEELWNNQKENSSQLTSSDIQWMNEFWNRFNKNFFLNYLHILENLSNDTLAEHIEHYLERINSLSEEINTYLNIFSKEEKENIPERIKNLTTKYSQINDKITASSNQPLYTLKEANEKEDKKRQREEKSEQTEEHTSKKPKTEEDKEEDKKDDNENQFRKKK